jgi:hypothetical protein
MKALFAIMAVVLLSASTGRARSEELKSSALRTEHDIYEAVLRWRLDANPLPRNARCYVYIANGHTAGLAARLTEYRIIVRAGAPDAKPPSDRWYWIRLGQVRPQRASLMLEDHKQGVRALDLVKKAGRWQVVVDEPFILH